MFIQGLIQELDPRVLRECISNLNFKSERIREPDEKGLFLLIYYSIIHKVITGVPLGIIQKY